MISEEKIKLIKNAAKELFYLEPDSFYNTLELYDEGYCTIYKVSYEQLKNIELIKTIEFNEINAIVGIDRYYNINIYGLQFDEYNKFSYELLEIYQIEKHLRWIKRNTDVWDEIRKIVNN